MRSIEQTFDTQPAMAGLRLTARGRLVVVLLTLGVAFTGFTFRGGPAASTGEVHHQRTATVVVTPGDTVWDIAQRAAPDQDPRTIVSDIVRLNSLPDAGAIRVGQPLLVPKI